MRVVQLPASVASITVSCGDPVVATDLDGRVISFNEAVVQLTGIPASEAVGSSCWEIIDGVDVTGEQFCRPDCAILASARQGRAVPCLELLVRTRVGRRRAVLTSLRVDCAESSALLHVIQASQPAFGSAATAGPPLTLTPRQREVLALLAEGLSTMEIAARLSVARDTARNHIRVVLRELGCHSRLEAVVAARRRGLV